jgi:hypothetical protein
LLLINQATAIKQALKCIQRFKVALYGRCIALGDNAVIYRNRQAGGFANCRSEVAKGCEGKSRATGAAKT